MNKISEILEHVSYDPDRIKTDSNDVLPGDVFIAVKGSKQDGHDFIADAVKRGAGYVVCEHVPDGCDVGSCRARLVDDSKAVREFIAREVFGKIGQGMSFFGVTGTNGKTTTSFLLYNMLKASGEAPGLLSTVYNVCRGEENISSTMTTPGALYINRCIKEMSSYGKRSAVIEVSSHALDQGRISALGLDAAVFTNISPEHLDYHGDMKNYLKSKMRIFERLNDSGKAVINKDDSAVLEAAIGLKNETITFSLKDGADVSAHMIGAHPGGTEFLMKTRSFGDLKVKTQLIGVHNVYNILAAAAAFLHTGHGLGAVEEGLKYVNNVPGRLDKVNAGGPFDVFVDYAHTPDALENTLKCLRAVSRGNIICVFGCGGERDISKRGSMGEIAGRMCDKVIITDDNPRGEDPETIVSHIEKGIRNKGNYRVIRPRQDAIENAIASAGKGDIVLIAGKGHENYQIIGDDVMEFDDKKIANRILKRSGSGIHI